MGGDTIVGEAEGEMGVGFEVPGVTDNGGVVRLG